MFKHPSPWDYVFFMNSALGRDLGWFWNYWLFTTESVDGSIANVATAGGRTTVTVRQDGQMPSPVVLKVEFAASGAPIRGMPNAKMVDARTAIVTWPVDVWFRGARTYAADARLRRAGDRADHARPGGPLPGPRPVGQRVAPALGTGPYCHSSLRPE